MTDTKSHVVIFSLHARSHLRLDLSLALRFLEVHPSLRCTFMLSDKGVAMYEEERAQLSAVHKGDLWNRLRLEIVQTPTELPDNPFAETAFLETNTVANFVALAKDKNQEEWAPSPTLFLVDVFRMSLKPAILQAYESVSKTPPPVFMILNASAAAFPRLLGRDTRGGASENVMKRYRDYKNSGMEENAAAVKAYRYVEDRLLTYPNMPPMFDSPMAGVREFTPSIVTIWDTIYRAEESADGNVILSVPEVDGDLLEWIKKDTEKPLVAVGLVYCVSICADLLCMPYHEPFDTKDGHEELFAFLDTALREHGPNSVVYLSLGTTAWPTKDPSMLEIIIDSLLELDPPMPFVWATATKDGKFSPSIREKVAASKRGMIIDWVPQIEVLKHSAVRCFLTHCGMGSIMESIFAEVPLICLPFAADQPLLAKFYAEGRQIGITLVNFATLDGLKLGNGKCCERTPEAMRAEIDNAWNVMRGWEGDKFRSNVATLKASIEKSWANGETRRGVESLANWFDPPA